MQTIIDEDKDDFIFEVPDLTDDNYLLWYRRLEVVLQAYSGRLWPLVSGSETAPDPETSSDDARKTFKRRQGIAVCLIARCIPTHMHAYWGITGVQDPKVMWDKVRETYRGWLHPWIVRREMYSIRRENFPSVDDYTLKIDSLVLKYNFAVEDDPERTVPEEEHTFLYVNGLPDSWEIPKLAWMMDNTGLIRDPLRLAISMRDIDKMREMREDRQKEDARKRKREEDALQIERDRNVKCFRCRERGHRKNNCPW
jgi:hypothetical protein